MSDARTAARERLAGLSLEQKAGLLFQPSFTIRFAGEGGRRQAEEVGRVSRLITERHIRHFNIRGSVAGSATPGAVARMLNGLQSVAASSPGSIPISIASDPRHAFSNEPGVSIRAGHMSRWPEPLGLGALGDAETVRQFGDVVRQEYRALGVHTGLHPQADLATEPRWMRNSGTFGQNPSRVAELVAAYLRGAQGDVFGPTSISCMVKHFPGAGPQEDGEDPHFERGKNQVYPGGFFDTHLRMFEAALAAGARQVMPYYGRPVGTEYEEVGFAFNRGIVTGLLRERLEFGGVVCSDWNILTDGVYEGQAMPAIAWGLEDRTAGERMLAALDAGIDQFGGESCTHELLRLVDEGLVDEARIDTSAMRLLEEKQLLGLFETAQVDPDAADGIVGRADFVEAGRSAQRRAVVVLENGRDGPPLLPLPEGTPLRVVSYGEEAVPSSEQPSASEDALTLLRVRTPFDLRPHSFERHHRPGRLYFTSAELAELAEAMGPRAILAVQLDRPAVMPELLGRADAVLAFCGASDEAVLDVVYGRATPEGRLPVDLPASWAAVLRHDPDRPGGTDDPLYTEGWSAGAAEWVRTPRAD